MRKYWVLMTDGRARTAAAALEEAAPLIGDMAARPAAAPALLRPLKLRLLAALKRGRPSSLGAAAAAEDFAARLEKVFSDMALLQAPPDRAVLEALKALQAACPLAGALLGGGRADAYARLLALSAAGRKTLAQARAGADGAGFPQNLKFSSIYAGLDAVFDALERCGEALFRI